MISTTAMPSRRTRRGTSIAVAMANSRRTRTTPAVPAIMEEEADQVRLHDQPTLHTRSHHQLPGTFFNTLGPGRPGSSGQIRKLHPFAQTQQLSWLNSPPARKLHANRLQICPSPPQKTPSLRSNAQHVKFNGTLQSEASTQLLRPGHLQ